MECKLLASFIVSILVWTPPKQTQARLFTFKKLGTDSACMMMDIDFTAEIQALKDNKVVAAKTWTSNDNGISTSGICSGPTNELLLIFQTKSFWYIAFRKITDKVYHVGQYRGLQFVPKELFGQTVNVTDDQIYFDAQATYQTDDYTSYFCATKTQATYSTIEPFSGGFSFNVTVSVSYIQSQGFNIKNNTFGPKEHC